jgi:hypothetical protein
MVVVVARTSCCPPPPLGVSREEAEALRPCEETDEMDQQ